MAAMLAPALGLRRAERSSAQLCVLDGTRTLKGAGAG